MQTKGSFSRECRRRLASKRWGKKMDEIYYTWENLLRSCKNLQRQTVMWCQSFTIKPDPTFAELKKGRRGFPANKVASYFIHTFDDFWRFSRQNPAKPTKYVRLNQNSPTNRIGWLHFTYIHTYIHYLRNMYVHIYENYSRATQYNLFPIGNKSNSDQTRIHGGHKFTNLSSTFKTKRIRDSIPQRREEKIERWEFGKWRIHHYARRWMAKIINSGKCGTGTSKLGRTYLFCTVIGLVWMKFRSVSFRTYNITGQRYSIFK